MIAVICQLLCQVEGEGGLAGATYADVTDYHDRDGQPVTLQDMAVVQSAAQGRQTPKQPANSQQNQMPRTSSIPELFQSSHIVPVQPCRLIGFVLRGKGDAAKACLPGGCHHVDD